MTKNINLSYKAKMLLECVYDCKDIQELKNNNYPNNTLTELEEGLEFCGNCEEEFPELTAFLGGIEYQKNNTKRKSKTHGYALNATQKYTQKQNKKKTRR